MTKNDKILSINGHKTYGSSLDELIDHMRGAPGTKVDLELLKANAPAPRSVTIKEKSSRSTVLHLNRLSIKIMTISTWQLIVSLVEQLVK